MIDKRFFFIVLLILIGINILGYYVHEKHFFIFIDHISLVLSPLLILLLGVLGLQKEYKRPFRVFRFVLLHFILSVNIIVIIGILLPVLSDKEEISISSQEAGNRLNDAVETAIRVGNLEERDAFLSYYEIHKNQFTNFAYENINQGIKGIPDITEQKKFKKNKDLFFDPKVTSDNVTNMSRRDILFNARNYIDRGFFHTAELWLNYYVEIYGEDNSSYDILNLIEKKSNSEERLLPNFGNNKNFYSQIEYLYDIATKKEYTKEEIVYAYFLLNIFYEIYQKEDFAKEVLWIQDEIDKKLSEFVFFANDSRVFLFNFHRLRSISFVEQLPGEIRVWYAKDYIHKFDDDTMYFKDLEILLFSRETQDIKWHIKTPYAKKVGSKIYLESIEKSALGISYKPEVLVQSTPNVLVPRIMDISPDLTSLDISRLQPHYFYVGHRVFSDLFSHIRLWRNYGLPTNLLYEAITKMVLLMLVFIVSGIRMIGLMFLISYRKFSYRLGIIYFGIVAIGIIPFQIIVNQFIVEWYRFVAVKYELLSLIVLFCFAVLVVVFMYAHLFVYVKRMQREQKLVF